REIAAHAHAEAIEPDAPRELAQEGEVDRRRLVDRRNAHQPAYRQRQLVPAMGDEGCRLGGGADPPADGGEIAGDVREAHVRIVPAESSGNRRRTLGPMEILVYSGLELLGDGVMKLPFVRALRQCWPAARITWLAGKGKTVYAGILAP